MEKQLSYPCDCGATLNSDGSCDDVRCYDHLALQEVVYPESGSTQRERMLRRRAKVCFWIAIVLVLIEAVIVMRHGGLL